MNPGDEYTDEKFHRKAAGKFVPFQLLLANLEDSLCSLHVFQGGSGGRKRISEEVRDKPGLISSSYEEGQLPPV